MVVFSSSVAVFGGSAEQVITDDTWPTPQTSYGTQKVMCEYLLADYTRKGFLNGRAVRLMTVSVRPGRPNAAASGFLSGIIREPLAGQRAVCPVDPGTEVALASPAKAVGALLRAATSSDEAWGGRTALTMPALTLTVADMAAALTRVGGPAGQRADRLGPRPRDCPDVRHLARPDPRRPGRPAGPDPRPRLRLRDQDAPGRIMTDPCRVLVMAEAILGCAQ